MWKGFISSSITTSTTSAHPDPHLHLLSLSHTHTLSYTPFARVLFSIRFLQPQSLLSSSPPAAPAATSTGPSDSDQAPPGTVKSIIPCTPLAIVKCLEHIGVYNRLLPYGDKAYGKTVTVINRCAFFLSLLCQLWNVETRNIGYC